MAPVTAARKHNLRVLVSKSERDMVRDIAADSGLTVADTVRQLIREKWAARPKRKLKIRT